MNLRFLSWAMLCGSLALEPVLAADLPDSTVSQPRRLSDALFQAGYTWPAIQGHALWLRQSNLAAQQIEKQALVQLLQEQSRRSPMHEGVSAFVSWWLAQPVTGAEWVPETDPSQLVLHPELDPWLAAADTVHIVPLPVSIAVLDGLGAPCSVAFLPRATVRDYLAACLPGRSVDTVQIVNPGQQPRRLDVAAWNADDEMLAMPGAWIILSPPVLTSVDQDALVQAIATLGPFQEAASRVPALLALDGKDMDPTSSDWGAVGLLQTPTARFRDAGSVSATFSHVRPYSRYNIMLQPFDWLEAGFRYTDVSNRQYGPDSLSGSQTYKDKSIDVKFRLSQETATMPQLALGLRDIGGTGFFASEYVVASKRREEFDFSLGLAWGNLASRGHFSNPFSFLLSDSFDQREVSEIPGATSVNYFKGPTSLLGGVEWHLRDRPLILKLEYDANSYQQEILGNRFDVAFPFNVGATYRWGNNIEAQAALERGNTLSLGFTLHGNLSRLQSAKTADAPSLAIQQDRPRERQDSWTSIAGRIQAQTGSEVLEIRKAADEVKVTLSPPSALYVASRFERAGRVLHDSMDDKVRWFDFKVENVGLPVTQVVVDRDALATRATTWTPVREREPVLSAESPMPATPADELVYQKNPSPAGYQLGVDYSQILGGPNGFLLFQVDAVASGRLSFSRDTWLYGALRGRLYDNYDDFKYDSKSGTLPRVRTDIRRYLTESPIQLANLQLTHVRDLGDDMFVMFYGGYLERMFAGVGAEWLLRPQGSPVAIGVDINRVRQRDFEEGFGLRDYTVTTGHASLYLDTGIQDILAVFKVGRYLAGDVGLTADFSRIFRNGVNMGAYATITSASKQEYGEGSFTKGIYVNVPFDALFDSSARNVSAFNWSPLTRDGGALLNRAAGLYGLLDLRHPRTLGLMSAEKQ